MRMQRDQKITINKKIVGVGYTFCHILPHVRHKIKTIKQMNKKVKKQKVILAGSDSMFFRGEHPDQRTDKQWVTYMNKKYGTKWNGRD